MTNNQLDLDELRDLAADVGNMLRLTDRLAPVLAAWRRDSEDGDSRPLGASSGVDAVATPDRPSETPLANGAPAGPDGAAISTPEPVNRQKRRCDGCGTEFEIRPHGERKRWCSRKCADRETVRRRRVRKRANSGATREPRPPAAEPERDTIPAQTEPQHPRRHDVGAIPLPTSAAGERDPQISAALQDIAKLPPATACFGPRPPPPAVDWHAESSPRPRSVRDDGLTI